MTTVSIRLAIPAELTMIRKQSAAAAADLVNKHGQGRWQVIPTRSSLSRYLESDTLFVIEKEASVVGTFCFVTRKIVFYRKGWFAFPDDPAGYLINMAIDPQYQRLGVGRQVMNELGKLAGRMKLLAIRLDAYQGAAGAGEFYRKCGCLLVHEGKVGDVGLEYYEKVLRELPGSEPPRTRS